MAVMKKENVARRLLPGLLDDLAQRDPTRKFCTMPKSSEVSDGFVDVTMKDLAQAVNSMSWWIEKSLGRSSTRETLTYLGGNDIRYIISMLACSKTGYKIFLPSPRNSDEAFRHVLKATETKNFLYSGERKQKMIEINGLRPDINALEVPALAELLGGQAELYPYHGIYEKLEDDVLFIIHSSGSTGMPKLVPITHGFISVMDNAQHFPCPPGRQFSLGGLNSSDLVLSVAPLFHLMGLFSPIRSLQHGIPFLIAPDKPPSIELLTQMIETAQPTCGILPPSLLEEMSDSSHGLNVLSRLKYIFYGGAPLAPEAGNKLKQVTDIRVALGSSEVGVTITMAPLDKEDWQYMEWSPFYGIDMQLIGDNMYEMVIPRAGSRDFHGVFHTYPELQEYRTKDLFTSHPKKPGLWKFYGRLDDVIVLSNGEKFNPITMEKMIEGHPLVGRAVIVGQGRFQSALLVEPNWNQWNGENPDTALVDEIWPTVQEANHVGLAHGRVMKTNIGVAPRDKPFKTTPKGSTQRLRVMLDFEEEINAIYASSSEDESEGILPEGADLDAMKEYIRKVVSSKVSAPDFSDEDDIFAAGLDSLQTIHLAKVLGNAVHSCYPDKNYNAITPQEVYKHPTVNQLSQLLNAIVNGEATETESRAAIINALVEKYTADIPGKYLDAPSISGKGAVILTGSTGSLGNYLLNTLLEDPAVSKIYCLNRSENAKTRQEESFQEKGLEPDFARVEFLQASFGKENFGLGNSKYEEMSKSVTTVIHNAWKVDFNHPVSSFEDDHIRGIRHFIDFSLKSTHHAHIHFISSIGTVSAWSLNHGPKVPEVPLENCEVTGPQGYSESKHVAERICLAASRKAGVPTTIYRVGQIAGPTTKNGLWNRQEWLPTIIATSKSMGKIPDTLGHAVVDWIPVDTLATIILEVVNNRNHTVSETRCAAFHMVNPSVQPWEALIPAVRQHYPIIQPVSLSTWLEDLEKIESPSEAEIRDKPALKLLSFYRSLLGEEGALSVPLDVQKTREASATMRALGPVGGKLLGNWLRQWDF